MTRLSRLTTSEFNVTSFAQSCNISLIHGNKSYCQCNNTAFYGGQCAKSNDVIVTICELSINVTIMFFFYSEGMASI